MAVGNGGKYHDMHEPWWPAHSVMYQSDRTEGVELFNANHFVGLTAPHKKLALMDYNTIKIVDTAIAHALREAYRN